MGPSPKSMSAYESKRWMQNTDKLPEHIILTIANKQGYQVSHPQMTARLQRTMHHITTRGPKSEYGQEIIPEIRILRLTSWKVSLKMLYWKNYNRFTYLYTVCLKTIGHLNLKLWIFSGHTAIFKIWVSKVQDFGKFELSPMKASYHNARTKHETHKRCNNTELAKAEAPT